MISRRLSIGLLVSLLPLSVFAADDAPLLLSPGHIITQPDLKSPPGEGWSVGKGKWEAAEGVMTAYEISEEHHAAVLHLATGPVPLIVECDFRFGSTGKVFYVGCDGSKHVGRVVIVPKSVKICEDSTEVKGKTPSHTLAEEAINAQPDEWQHVRVEWTGEQMAARFNDKELRAEHPYLATPKVRWWLATSGDGVQVRNLRVTEGVPLPTPAGAKPQP